MNAVNEPSSEQPGSSDDRFVRAVLAAWRNHGHAAISARSLARDAGAPVSSMYNRHGGLEQLFRTAQADAIAAARQWCAAQRAYLAPVTEFPADAFAPLFAAMVDGWARDPGVFAWRECYLMATRDPAFLDLWREWCRMWGDFWQDVCGCFGLAEHARLVAFVFDSECLLHLMDLDDPVRRVCLGEFATGLAHWLAGAFADEGPWWSGARVQAERNLPDFADSDAVAERIAMAAADCLEERGMAGLTHRAAAARAGVSAGAVSNRFRTSADLARAALEMVYRRSILAGAAPPRAIGGAELLHGFVHYRMSQAQRLAFDELLLAVARTPELRPFSTQLRYLRGRSSGVILRSLAGAGRAVSPLDAAIFSAFTAGLQRACVGLDEAEAPRVARAELEALARLLDCTGADAGADRT